MEKEINILYDEFENLSDNDFDVVYENYKRLKKQYRYLMLARKLDLININVINTPILHFITMLISFIKFKLYDFCISKCSNCEFNEFGLTMYCGRQGSGKTISMVEYLDRMRKKYPDCIIITNFNYIYEDMAFTDWRQFLEVRNGVKGVIFAIDELQNEYNSSSWQGFPDEILSVVTQQRKQRIKIVGTTQVFTRIVKQLREQCYEVIDCRTFSGRWTRERCYDADYYNKICNSNDVDIKLKLPRKYKYSFIQTNYIRNLYDSYAVIDRMKNLEFNEKGVKNNE